MDAYMAWAITLMAFSIGSFAGWAAGRVTREDDQ